MWHLGRRDLGIGRGMATPFVATPDVLKAAPSPNRVMAHCSLPLARVRAVAKRGNAKINDVLLAVLDIALNHYLAEHGLHTKRPLVADMPVALHEGPGAGNRITILQVPMGRPGGTPAERLADIVAETRLVKEEVKSIGADALFMYSIFEHAVASAIESLNLGELPMLANAVISNPAGLEGKVYFNGLPVELALPVSVVAHHQVLNITISNYDDELHVTFIALREAVPDVQRLADATMRALVELQHSLTQRPATAGKKAPTGRQACRHEAPPGPGKASKGFDRDAHTCISLRPNSPTAGHTAWTSVLSRATSQSLQGSVRASSCATAAHPLPSGLRQTWLHGARNSRPGCEPCRWSHWRSIASSSCPQRDHRGSTRDCRSPPATRSPGSRPAACTCRGRSISGCHRRFSSGHVTGDVGHRAARHARYSQLPGRG